MKVLHSLLLATVLTAVPVASAQKVDISSLKCQDFIKQGQPNLDMMLMWLIGLYTEVSDGDVIDLSQLETNRRKFSEFCSANPGFSVSVAAEGLLGK
jgi:acid stress chaperone HdeB